MKSIAKIVESLRATVKLTEKLNILKANKDNELLKKVLYYTYNSYMKYGVSEKTLNNVAFITNRESIYENIFDLLDTLARSNINDKLRQEVALFFGSVKDEEIKELYKCILLKDLNIGCNVKTINKVYSNLIPTFSCMLSESLFKNNNMQRIQEKEFILTQKLDGNRIVAIKSNGKTTFFTRQGKEIDGLVELEEDFKLFPNNMVLDGEILLSNDKGLNSDDLFRETMKECRKKGEKHNLYFNAFDLVTLDGFYKGVDETPCTIRKERLHKLIEESNFKYILEVPILYKGKDVAKIDEFLQKAIQMNQEGCMLNLCEAPYEAKRVKTQLKIKAMNEVDLRVLGVFEGEGNFKHTLGGITVAFEHEGGSYTVGIGSGFSKEEREMFWNNPELIVKKIVRIQYFEVSKNKEGGFSLRFPVFKGVCDKDEVSYF